jgi:small subunit ribosomal protein S6
MNKYELTIVLPGKMSSAKRKSTRELVEKLVKMLKGEIKKVDDRGELELAYPIARNNTGVFIHFDLELEAQSPKSINDKLKMEEDVIRYLLVRKE